MKSGFSPMIGCIPMENSQIYYEVQGDGQPVLLIPGSGGDSWWLHKIAGELAKNFKVITYDLRGCARSISDGPLNIEMCRLSADATNVLDAAGVKSAYVIGVSSGAIIALDMASRYPERVDGIIAFEPPLIQLHTRRIQLQKMIAKVYATALNCGAGFAGLKFALGAGLPE